MGEVLRLQGDEVIALQKVESRLEIVPVEEPVGIGG
jgi:hypothetical protein